MDPAQGREFVAARSCSRIATLGSTSNGLLLAGEAVA
jgi:hypothetical protein